MSASKVWRWVVRKQDPKDWQYLKSIALVDFGPYFKAVYGRRIGGVAYDCYQLEVPGIDGTCYCRIEETQKVLRITVAVPDSGALDNALLESTFKALSAVAA